MLTTRLATLLALLVACLMLSFAARAQSSVQGQTSSAYGTSAATIAPGAISVNSFGAPQLPYTKVRSEFHTNQAQSAPANIGSTSAAQFGCPAVDGWSVSVAVANGGKTDAKELPGCMLNIFALGVVPTLKTVVVDRVEQFDWQSKARLEALCLHDLYRAAIENGLPFKCKATREAEERQAKSTVANVVVVQGYQGNDPIVIERLAKQGRR